MSWPSLRTTFVAAAVVTAGVHLTAVTMESLPPNRYSAAVADQTGYLDPFFTQNWRLFAPNPVSEDRAVLFQGAYRDEDGDIVETEWIDWTEVELDLVRHQLVGGRAGYITNKLYSPLRARFGALPPDQQQVVDATSVEDPPEWAELRLDLAEDGRVSRAADSFLRYERATAQLATNVLLSRHPGREFVAVRYATRSQGVTPYDARSGDDEERAAARPPASQSTGGWRVPTPGSDAERRAVADFDARHR